LAFGQVFAWGYRPSEGFSWVRHEPIVLVTTYPKAGDILEGAQLGEVSMRSLLDDLALAVLAHKRSGRAIAEPLRMLVDLFANDEQEVSQPMTTDGSLGGASSAQTPGAGMSSSDKADELENEDELGAATVAQMWKSAGHQLDRADVAAARLLSLLEGR
jgi:hypothetical protein